MDSCNLLVEIDVYREFVESVRLGRCVTVPNNLLALLPAQALFFLLAFPALLVRLRTEDIDTSPGKVLEGRDNIGTALELGSLSLAGFEEIALFLPLGIEQLDTHVLLKFVDRDLLTANRASCHCRLRVLGPNWEGIRTSSESNWVELTFGDIVCADLHRSAH